MTHLRSTVDPASAAFKANQDVLSKQLQDLADKLAVIKMGGGEVARAKHQARGKLIAFVI